MTFRITPRASADLEEIWQYVARDSPVAADKVDSELHAAMQMLARFPGLGHRRDDVARPDYRFWPVFSWLIAYRRDEDSIHIIRVVHGSRDVHSEMRG